MCVDFKPVNAGFSDILYKSHRVGIEEQSIVFRPSPNFKKMKKFLKSKIDFIGNSYQVSLHDTEQFSTSPSPEPITTKEEQRALLEKAKSSSQPPLPPVPPFLSPINLNLPQKQEIQINDYEKSNEGSPEVLAQQEELANSPYESTTTEGTNTINPSKPTICRDFIRGTCSRAGTCKYAHKRDLTQLPGVYTFCRNYQNSSCTFPHCRYVHASIFEEQRFYRTGNLPPHALSHHKKPTALAPPPPPPPPPPPEETPVEVPIFANPPPAVIPSVDKPVITCVPTANLESRPVEYDFRINQPRDLDTKSAKKCKNCDTMEFRLQFNKDKAKNMKRTTDELKNKVGILTKKTHTLYSVLLALTKLQANKARPEGLNGISSLFSITNESEKNHLPTGNININLSHLLLKDIAEQNRTSDARDS